MVEVDVQLDAGAPGRARAALEPLRDAMPAQQFGDLRLLVSELIVDDLRSDSSTDRNLRLRAAMESERVRVEMTEGWTPADSAPERPEPGEPGWGIYLTDLLSDRWGIEPAGSGATVWLEKAVGRRSD